MEELNPVQVLTDHFLKSKKFTLKGKSLYCDGLRVVKLRDQYENDDDLLENLNLFKVVKGSNADVKTLDSSVIDNIKETLKKKLLKEEQEHINGIIGDSPTSVFNIEDFVLYIDLEGESDSKLSDYFLFNKRLGRIASQFKVGAYKKLMGNDSFDKLKASCPSAFKEYNPTLINKDLKDRTWYEHHPDFGCDILRVNTCVHPEFRYKRNLNAKIDPEIHRFIRSSFTTEESYQYFIDASYMTVFDKMWPYVFLLSAKGTGKTTLVEMLIQLVGKENYRKAPQNALTKEFNDYKKNKRLVLMDELSAKTNEQVNILKSDANREFNVEGKGVSAEAVKNHVSIWIASNNISDWNFTWDERRFSVLEMTDTSTVDRGFSDDWMKDLSQYVNEDPKWCDEYFNYLEQNKSKDFDNYPAYKPEKFYTIVLESLPGWQRKIVDTIIDGECSGEFMVGDILDPNEKLVATHHKKYTDFFNNFKYKGEPIATYKKEASIRDSVIIPNKKFLSNVQEDDLI